MSASAPQPRARELRLRPHLGSDASGNIFPWLAANICSVRFRERSTAAAHARSTDAIAAQGGVT